MTNKRDRHAAILEVIEGRAVASQEELRRLLHQRGWDVTQSTLSRDLREMGLARIPTPDGGARYAPPGGSGGAGPLAVALDAEEWPEVMGTIAGDDTILIVCRSSGARERLVRRLAAIAAS